jgi:hypothetical protein
MSTTRVISSTAIAAAAAILFNLSAMSVASADEAKVHCSGANACKGQSACKSAHNACKGQNGCKGQGFLEVTKQECDAAKSKS